MVKVVTFFLTDLLLTGALSIIQAARLLGTLARVIILS